MCISGIPGKYRIPWLDEIPDLNKVVDLGTYGRAHSGVEVEGFVYLQVEVAPPYALLEAREIADLSLSHPRVTGYVPWAPLEYGDRCRHFLEDFFDQSKDQRCAADRPERTRSGVLFAGRFRAGESVARGVWIE